MHCIRHERIAPMKRLLICAALLVAGCAQSHALNDTGTVDNSGSAPSTTLAAARTPTAAPPGGSASVNIVWPCPALGNWVPDVLKADLNILVDGKPTGTLRVCQHKQFTVAAGKRSFRLADKYLDFGALFGNGDTFALPPGERLYLIASPDGDGNVFVHEVSVARWQAEMAAIDTN
jgi:hypothetical protein